MKRLLMLLVMLLMVGCAATPKPENRVIFVPVPAEFISACFQPKPPGIEFYVSHQFITKEKILTDFIFTLQTDLELCNVQIGKIRKWSDDMEKRFPAVKGNK